MSAQEIAAKAKGKFRLQKKDSVTGDITYDSGEFDNALLNNFFTSNPSLGMCFVGTDSSVTNSDTTLSVIGTNTNKRTKSTNYSVDAAGLVTWNYVNEYTFTSGAIVGNMSCIGISSSTAVSGTNLKVKSLIKDINGDPTTIPATATDQIIVTHTLTVTFNQHQVLTPIVIDGVTHQIDFYSVFVATGDNAGATLDGHAPCIYFGGFSIDNYPKVSASFTPPTIPTLVSTKFNLTGAVYTGALSTNSFTYDSSGGKLKANYTVPIPANFNLAGNAPIKALGYGDSPSGSTVYNAFEFTPALPKNNSIAYSIIFSFTLARA